MKQSLLISLGIVLLLSVGAAGAAILIGEGPVELNPDEYVNITPANSTETYKVPRATVLGALDAASIPGAFEYEVALDLSPEEGNLSILSINGVENEVLNETPHAWTFWVNGEGATTGPAVTDVVDGDTVSFSYGPPGHSMENASYTLIVHASVSGVEVTPAAEASVNITVPEEGAEIAAGNVTVSVDVTNFTLVEPTGQENAPGEGHLHYYLDAPIPTDENEPAIPETGGYALSTNTSYTWEDVPAGEHTLSVQLVNNDHTPIIPLAVDMVNVTVSEEVTPAAEASVTITVPEEGAEIAAGNVTVSVDVTNFTLVEPTGQENAPGEGHLHYYLDAPIPTDETEPAIPETGGYALSTDTSYTWEDVPAGEHTLSVQLVNNDHTPIVPLAVNMVNVTVSEEVTPTPTEEVTPTPAEEVTPTPTEEVTPTPTEEVTPTPTEEVTPTPTEEVTPTPTEEVPTANVADEIVAGLSGEENLTTFVDVVSRSAAFQALDVNETYIVCAPTDEAFNDLDNETLSMFLEDTEFQDSVLWYHIIEGDYTLEELVMMCQNATDGQITLPTVEGEYVNVSLSEGGEVVINNALAVTQIQITNNIVIYVINVVLIPPEIPTPTPTPTEEVTPTPTEEVTPTPTEEVTPTPTEEVTPTPTEEVTPTPTEEVTPTPTEEVTPTPTEEVTPTPTEEVTPTPTEEVTPTPTEEVTPTPTETLPPVPPAEGIDLHLYDGWNFISIPRPLAEGNDTAIAVFGDLDTAGRALYTHAPATGFEPLGADTTLEVLDGYWVYSNGTATVRLIFSTDPVRTPAEKALSPGWNAVGYSDLTPSTANETFASVEDSWVYALGYDAENQSYRPALINNQSGPRGEDQDLFPTVGYWLFMRTDGTLAAISA